MCIRVQLFLSVHARAGEILETDDDASLSTSATRCYIENTLRHALRTLGRFSLAIDVTT